MEEKKKDVDVHSIGKNGSLEEIHKLVNAGTTYINGIDVLCFSSIHQAVSQGDTGIVRYLLENGTSRDIYEGYQLTYLAAVRDYLDILKLLVSYYGLNCLNYTIKNPIHEAAINGNVLIVEYLLENGTEVNIVGLGDRTPLHAAVEFCQQSVVELLLKNKADINAKDEMGCTPLHYAVIKENLPIIDMLIEYGADSHLRNRKRQSPLECATQSNCLNALRQLFKRGASFNCKRKFNCYQSLFLATQHGFLSVIIEFVRRGVDINIHSTKGHTLLHAACQFGQIEVVRYLLQNGANVNSKSQPNDTTPIYFAVKYWQPEIIELLISYGGLLENPCKNVSVLSLVRKQFNNRYVLQGSLRQTRCVRIIIQYALLLSRIPIPASGVNFRFFPHFFVRCQEEIWLMKSVLIGRSSISIYTFLRNSYQSDTKLGQYLQNEDIYRGINIVCKYLKKCVIYSDICRTARPLYKRGMERKSLLNVSDVYFKTVSPFLPAECRWEIFSYLSNADLKNIIRSFKANLRHVKDS
ncbi:uncharacterized protein [Diabrotica undecimpunctata]|uniref:uncharacterized protein n=1 Tax=Diabrotica undecimpunctata TaxID=50387 RepID=UPI003B63D103